MFSDIFPCQTTLKLIFLHGFGISCALCHAKDLSVMHKGLPIMHKGLPVMCEHLPVMHHGCNHDSHVIAMTS